MYNLLQDRNKSSDDFRKFLQYMITERNQLNGMHEDFREDFMFHYNRLPQYFDEFEKRNEHETLRQLAMIQMATDRIKNGIVI